MQGWRTVIVGLVTAVAVPGLSYLAGVDWTQYVSPNVALALSGSLTILMRWITTSPIGAKS